MEKTNLLVMAFPQLSGNATTLTVIIYFEDLAHKRMDSGLYFLGLVALFGWTLVILWMTRPFWTGKIKLHNEEDDPSEKI